MKNRSGVVWLALVAVLSISRLAAQDVTVTDPAWFDPENPPADQPPTFKKRPKPDFPDEIKTPGQVAYAIVEQWVDEKGGYLNRRALVSNPYADSALTEKATKIYPGKRAGKAIAASCWFAVIFNPRSAALNAADASPRLLSVAPHRT